MENESILQQEECSLTILEENYETVCWGCGLRLLLPSYSPVFKCGWCGAITNNMPKQYKPHWFDRCSDFRDRFFVLTVIVVILSMICGGIWAIYPVVFQEFNLSSSVHCLLTIAFASGTLVNYFLAAFRPAGKPPTILWGNYSVVGKGGLNDYNFCQFCSKPKSKRTHHCRSCKSCVLDMDHHCPFIGNCVGAGNFQHFIAFLFFALISNVYVLAMSLYAGLWIWPSLIYFADKPAVSVRSLTITNIVRYFIHGVMNTAVILSARAIALLYLSMASVAVVIGIGVLLYQQLYLLSTGQTYIESLKDRNEVSQQVHLSGGWRNVCNIFRYQHPVYWLFPRKLRSSPISKIHEK